MGVGVLLSSTPEVPELCYRYALLTCGIQKRPRELIVGFVYGNIGWMSVLAWQAGTASGSFLTGTLIQGLITVRNPDYTAPGWQGTLLVFSMVLVIYFFNVYASELMPLMSNLLMFFHILSWAVILIMLWATASHRSAEAVFVTDWKNIGGLPTMGVSVMVGQISAIYGCLSRYSY